MPKPINLFHFLSVGLSVDPQLLDVCSVPGCHVMCIHVRHRACCFELVSEPHSHLVTARTGVKASVLLCNGDVRQPRHDGDVEAS